MAYGSSDEYESSSDEAERPRWRGPASTWRHMNREEIDTLTGLNEIRNHDLSVHLYDAFALKQRHAQPFSAQGVPMLNEDINAATQRLIQQDDWVPQRSWTAWPMSAQRVPPDEFMPRTLDADEKFTLRRPCRDVPSAPLEEAVSAVILRFARERFESRPDEDADAAAAFEEQEEHGEEDDEERSDGESSVASGETRSRSKSTSRVRSEENDDEGDERAASQMDVDDGVSKKEHDPPSVGKVLKPVVSADDELSYKLLRPSVRHILSKLDATLMILHQSREAALNYISDSDDESEASEPSRPDRASSERSAEPTPRKRGRPRKSPLAIRSKRQYYYAQSSTLEPSQEAGQESQPPKKKKGRPRKEYPRLPGESDRDYVVRIARLRKEPIPIFDEDAESGTEPDSDVTSTTPRHSRFKKRKTSMLKSPSTDRSVRRARSREKSRAQLRLRDWKDVLGAAAIAGFPQQALDRAARRCADLFGQSMELRTLGERPLDCEDEDKVVQYTPDMAAMKTLDEDDFDEAEVVSQTRRQIRSVSVASDDSRGRPRSVSRARSTRSRSRSVSSVSVACSHFCPLQECPRSVDGFSRRSNLLRHMKEIHALDSDEALGDIDSEDEMLGAVHVDGFLEPIKIRRGWRGEDSRPISSSRREAWRQRKMNKGQNEGGSEITDVKMRDVSE